MVEPKKLKRVVIKEELVQLTGDYKLAIVLNQMIYWSERRHDADKFIAEEKDRFDKQYNSSNEVVFMEPSYGWIYKKAEELITETMMGLTVKTMLTYLNDLVAKGWLQKRRNPKHDFDRTYQYRVDLIKIQTDLLTLGYSLDGYDIGITNLQKVNCEILASIDNDELAFQKVNTDLQNVNSNNSAIDRIKGTEAPELCNLQNVNSNNKNINTDCKNVNTDCKNVKAIPETTTKNTTENTTDFIVDSEKKKMAEIVQDMFQRIDHLYK